MSRTRGTSRVDRSGAPKRRLRIRGVGMLTTLVLVGGVFMSGIPAARAVGPQLPPPPIWGYADLHAHQFGNLGYGGLMLWGAPFSPDDNITTALPYSDFLFCPHVTVLGFCEDVLGVGGTLAPVIYPVPPIWRPGCPAPLAVVGLSVPVPCPLVMIHGPGGVNDTVNLATTDSNRFGHPVGGALDIPASANDPSINPDPDLPFDGWPAWNVLTTQQMYYEWLRRSWQGGQRLMVMVAVNNELMCGAVYHLASMGCSDMPAIDRQVKAAKRLEAFIDAKAGGPGQGWYQIVYSGDEARQVMAQGKLAVVLGAEVDSLFGCTPNASCDEQDVTDGVQALYDMGIRHVFPVHLADNAFAGAALYNDVFDINTAITAGAFYTLAPCEDTAAAGTNLEFRMAWRETANTAADVGAALSAFYVGPYLAMALAAVASVGLPDNGPAGPHCNPRTLTGLGTKLVEELMDHQMIIDIDHASANTADMILQLAEDSNYPAIVGGHTGILAVSAVTPPPHDKTSRHEGQKTDTQLDRISSLGGMVGIILHQGGLDVVSQYQDPNGPGSVPLMCGGTSETFAQAYLYATDRMQGHGVAIGSDFNGFAGLPAPRKGPDACGGKAENIVSGYNTDPATSCLTPAACDLVQYPITPFGTRGPGLPRQQIGDRVIDYNTDGMASVGQLPDFIEELRILLKPDSDALIPLFRSAETYATMWQSAADVTPPTVICDPVPSSWVGVNVVISCSSTDWPSGLAPSSDASFTLNTWVTSGSEDPAALTNMRQVCDRSNNCTRVGPFSVAVDLRAPDVTISAPTARDYTHAEKLVLDYSATDLGSGVSTLAPTLDGAAALAGHGLTDGQTISLLTELSIGPHTFRVRAADAVGNERTASVTFSIVVTAESIKDDVTAFFASGGIKKAGTRTELLDKLNQAAAQVAAGDCAGASETYRAFIQAVQAQTGKAIAARASAILIADAQYLITHCP